jgi:hypothetical protein
MHHSLFHSGIKQDQGGGLSPVGSAEKRLRPANAIHHMQDQGLPLARFELHLEATFRKFKSKHPRALLVEIHNLLVKPALETADYYLLQSVPRDLHLLPYHAVNQFQRRLNFVVLKKSL